MYEVSTETERCNTQKRQREITRSHGGNFKGDSKKKPVIQFLGPPYPPLNNTKGTRMEIRKGFTR
jgi:hypothetical protein